MAKGESITFYVNRPAHDRLKLIAQQRGCKTVGELLQREAYKLAGFDQYGNPLPYQAPPGTPGGVVYPQQQQQQFQPRR